MQRTFALVLTGSALASSFGTASAQSTDKPAADSEALERVEVIGKFLGKGEARANTVVSAVDLQALPAGQDPLRLLGRVPGLQVSSSDALTGSFSMRLSMRGFNKEQIGMSIDGIPVGSTLSNGGTMPNRLLDPANLSWVEVAQTAGDIGTPSNQALGGFIEFKTRDPARKAGALVELSGGSFGYNREFVRVDTGTFAGGMRAYVDASHNYVKTWPGDQSGRSRRDHVDVVVLKEFDSRNKLRWSLSYNNMADNDYDALALRAGSRYKAVFEVNPNTDALTDAWTGNPAIDQNNRSTRGIKSKEFFTHLDGTFGFGEAGKLEIKPYLHTQEGNGYFYVPYKQVPANGVVYSAVPQGGRPVATAQECYANQYVRDANGALVPVSAVTFPAGVTAATLSAAGCPAAARFAMNPQASWGAREATSRVGIYDMNRSGVLAEASSPVGETQKLRAGVWFEHINRTKGRNWYLSTDPKVGPGYDESALYSTTQDRNYRSNTSMAYVQDKVRAMDDRLEIDLGLTAQRFSETYRSPVEFFGDRTLSVSSGVLPKIALLFNATDELEVFTSASKNFSALPDSVFEGTSAINSKTGVKPETSTNVDAGLRWSKGGHGVSLQIYSINYKNRISIQNGNPDGDIFSRDASTTFVNQGGIKSQGIELTGRSQIGPVALYGNLSTTNAHYVTDTPAEGIRASDPVLGAARFTAFAEATYRPHEGLRVAANVKYTGKAAGTYHEYPNTLNNGGPATYDREYMPAYTLVGLSGGWTLPKGWIGLTKKAEISFNVDNLFNERYLGGLGAELSTSNPLTTGRYFLGSPRTFFVTLRAEI